MWPRHKLTLPDERLTGVQQHFTTLHDHPLDSQVLPDVLSLTHLVVHDSGRTKKKKNSYMNPDTSQTHTTCLAVSQSFSFSVDRSADWSTWRVPPVLTWRSPNCFSPHAHAGCEPATHAASGCNEESEGETETHVWTTYWNECLQSFCVNTHADTWKFERFKAV